MNLYFVESLVLQEGTDGSGPEMAMWAEMGWGSGCWLSAQMGAEAALVFPVAWGGSTPASSMLRERLQAWGLLKGSLKKLIERLKIERSHQEAEQTGFVKWYGKRLNKKNAFPTLTVMSIKEPWCVYSQIHKPWWGWTSILISFLIFTNTAGRFIIHRAPW